eukprot:1034752-Pyramimonas_sp.AAC.1
MAAVRSREPVAEVHVVKYTGSCTSAMPQSTILMHCQGEGKSTAARACTLWGEGGGRGGDMGGDITLAQVWASLMATVRSREPVARCCPEGEKAQHITAVGCARSVFTQCQVAVLHTCRTGHPAQHGVTHGATHGATPKTFKP